MNNHTILKWMDRIPWILGIAIVGLTIHAFWPEIAEFVGFNIVVFLEWLAFILSMLCVFCYGVSKRIGALIGIITALTFIVWGLLSDIHAAALTNCIFIILHTRNLFISFKEKNIIEAKTMCDVENFINKHKKRRG